MSTEELFTSIKLSVKLNQYIIALCRHCYSWKRMNFVYHVNLLKTDKTRKWVFWKDNIGVKQYMQ